MPTKIVTAAAVGSAKEAAQSLLREMNEKLDETKPLLVLVFASTEQPLDQLVSALGEGLPGVTVAGASTAGEFTAAGETVGGVSLFALAGDYQVHAGFGAGLKATPEKAIDEAISSIPAKRAEFSHRTALLFIDGLAGAGEEATLSLAMKLGPEVLIAGGAAGDDWKVKHTHVAVGGKAASDAAVVVTIDSKVPLAMGVAHGFRPFGETTTDTVLKVTKASGSVIHELDGKPAWDVWAEATRAEAASDGNTPDGKDDFASALNYFVQYECALEVGSQFKMRLPLVRLEDGSLAFACGVPEGAELRMMRSNHDLQIDSARIAADRAVANMAGRAIAGALVFDCGCRKVLMKDQFFSSIETLSNRLGKVPLAGFESYGEVGLNVGDFSGFHNATTVLLAFPE